MNQEFNELDPVIYRGKEREYLRPGLRGAVVMIHDPENRVYEVEFFDEAGNELPTLAVFGDELELWKPS